jgi:DNA mismatch endonuclease (patch repair protein)
MDRISVSERSLNMAKIKSKNTAPEIKVRSILHRMGFRFRINVKILPGKPDIVLAKHHTVIFVHGCFWHRHGCKFSYIPKTRQDFWLNKFQENTIRDEKVDIRLRDLGWRVVKIWECETKDLTTLRHQLMRYFEPGS